MSANGAYVLTLHKLAGLLNCKLFQTLSEGCMESDKICRNLAFIAICTGVICTSTKAETLFFQGNMRSVQNGWQDDKLKIEIDTDGSKYRATLELL